MCHNPVPSGIFVPKTFIQVSKESNISVWESTDFPLQTADPEKTARKLPSRTSGFLRDPNERISDSDLQIHLNISQKASFSGNGPWLAWASSIGSTLSSRPTDRMRHAGFIRCQLFECSRWWPLTMEHQQLHGSAGIRIAFDA
jgi:hypothetical protein